ncbi:hypothetical protein N302_12002, partial [Corvus brachyrhynchos]
QAVGNQGLIYIKTPFSLVELQQWKASVRRYRENPEKVANFVGKAVKTQNPHWNNLDAMMDTLLDETEKEMVRRTVITAIEAQIAARTLQGPVNDIFPLNDPGWDPNVTEQMVRLKCYQNWVVFCIKCAIPKAVNWSKLYEISQDRNETPTDFL